MSFGQALMIALSGFITVFLMLVILWGLIVAINKVTSSFIKEPEVKKAPRRTPAARPAPATAAEAVETEKKTYGGEIKLFNVDEKTAACIMAIISDETKIPLDQLIFRSIKAVE